MIKNDENIKINDEFFFEAFSCHISNIMRLN